MTGSDRRLGGRPSNEVREPPEPGQSPEWGPPQWGGLVVLVVVLVGMGLFFLFSERVEVEPLGTGQASPVHPERVTAPGRAVRQDTSTEDMAERQRIEELSTAVAQAALLLEEMEQRNERLMAELARRDSAARQSPMRIGGRSTGALPSIRRAAEAPAAQNALDVALRNSGLLGGEEGGGPDRGSLAGRLISRGGSVSEAYARNPSWIVPEGAVIPGVLETRLDSSLPGPVRALVSRPVYAEDGGRVLLPAATRLIGEYQASNAPGDTRIFVTWQRIIRPDGSRVDITSPAVDGAGAPGVGGDVDTRFWQRFGGAMLLSIINEAGEVSRDSDDTVVRLFGESGSRTGAETVGAIADIPPRIVTERGSKISVFVNQDLDFEAVDS